MIELTAQQRALCDSAPSDYSDLRAPYLNCTLKKTGERSHTEGLMEIMARSGVTVEALRPVDFEIAFGVWPNMTEHGWARDDWLQLYAEVQRADILVVGTPINPSATPCLHRRTRAGSVRPARAHRTWIPDLVDRRTITPTARAASDERTACRSSR